MRAIGRLGRDMSLLADVDEDQKQSQGLAGTLTLTAANQLLLYGHYDCFYRSSCPTTTTLQTQTCPTWQETPNHGDAPILSIRVHYDQ